MYFGIEAVSQALKELEDVHPFYTITYLVFKQHNLPVGTSTEFRINRLERQFLEKYYKPDKQSTWFYRPNRTSDKEKHWVTVRYPETTSQSIRTRGQKAAAFIHDTNTTWGWKPNYIDILGQGLFREKRIPAFYLAVWLYRERDWSYGTTATDVLNTFLVEFNITQQESQQLFDTDILTGWTEDRLFQPIPVSLEQLRPIIGSPPGQAEGGGTLAYLELKGIGPSADLRFAPGSRINLITGDNGLGKTFLLECAWWALTGQWVGLPAYPLQDHDKSEITFQIASETSTTKKYSVRYDWSIPTWPERPPNQTIPGLLIYARADNSFAIWDPIQQIKGSRQQENLVFNPDEVWEGKEVREGAKTRFVSNGLIRDWVSWQRNPELSPFSMFTSVLARLSPGEEMTLEPAMPRGIYGDSREFPTLALPYGDIPVIHAAAGMRRILAIAYLIVWAWSEHKRQSELAKRAPQRRMVILIDEIEAHLHPRWQRLILPSMLDVQGELDPELQVQFLFATHSPLVMASVEPIFNEQTDKLFHLDLIPNDFFSRRVVLDEIPFVRLGQVNSWLTSEVFELGHARNIEAENAIEAAKALQIQDSPNVDEITQVTDELIRYLAADDEFWPRWIAFAEQHGVTV